MKAWLRWIVARSPLLAITLVAIAMGASLVGVRLITSSSYRLALHWDKGGLELSPTHP